MSIKNIIGDHSEVNIITRLVDQDKYKQTVAKLRVCGCNIVDGDGLVAYRQGKDIKILTTKELNTEVISELGFNRVLVSNLDTLDISGVSASSIISGIEANKVIGYDNVVIKKKYTGTVFIGKWTLGTRRLNIRLEDSIVNEVDMTGVNWEYIPYTYKLIHRSKVNKILIKGYKLNKADDMICYSLVNFIELTSSDLTGMCDDEPRIVTHSEVGKVDISNSIVNIEKLPKMFMGTSIDKLIMNNVEIQDFKNENNSNKKSCVDMLEINDTNITSEQIKKLIKAMDVRYIRSNVDEVIKVCRELKIRDTREGMI